MRCPRDTPAHRAIALAGWVFAVVGLVGLIVYPRAIMLWVSLFAFGVAAVPRAVIEWLRNRQRH